jgi:hypothetical protein
MPGTGDLDERGIREWNAHSLALATVDSMVPKRAAGDTVRGPSGAAVCARAITVCEWSDDDIARIDVPHVRADLLDHADELMADLTRRVR